MLKNVETSLPKIFVKLKPFWGKLAPAAPTPLRGCGETRRSQVAGCVDESILFGGRVYLLRRGLSWKTTRYCSVVLNWEGVKKYPGGREPFHALQQCGPIAGPRAAWSRHSA